MIISGWGKKGKNAFQYVDTEQLKVRLVPPICIFKCFITKSILLFRKQMYWLIQIQNVALKDLTPMIALHVDSLLMIQLYALEVQPPLLEFALETAEVSSY